jgi:hypothetical protein
MKGILMPILTGLIFLILAILCLCFPYKIQQYGLHNSGKGIKKFDPLLPWVKTQSYIWTLRIIGTIFFLIVILSIIIVCIGNN